jgi:TetR/AcrR family transcriptional repressor of mexCD-oprJ operon
MPEQAVDHRRAVADRNGAAILAATERLLADRKQLTMAAIAGEAGVSRPTLYAHFATIGEIVEAVVDKAVHDAIEVIVGADLESGPPREALTRLITTAWTHLAGLDALAGGATEHLPDKYLHRAHAPLIEHIGGLVARGQKAGDFRNDMPTEWLVRSYFALVHAADEYARGASVERDVALDQLITSVQDLFAAR